MTIGSPNQANAAPTSPDSNGRRMSRLVSIVARTGCYPLRDRQILFLVRLSLQDCFSLRRVYLRLRVRFLLLLPERKTNIVPTGGTDAPGSLHGSLMRPIHCAPNLRRLSWERLRLFIFSFFDHPRGWQEHSFPTLHSAFPAQLLCERVPAFGTDIVFLALNFLLQTIFCFAAEIANNHGFLSLKLGATVLVSFV